jgi:signal transduction histidine kinase
MSTFVHELTALLNVAATIEGQLRDLGGTLSEADARTRRQLQQALASVVALRQGIERQASYIADIATADARRRRSKQPLSSQFESAASLLALQAERLGITVENVIPEDFRTPSMYRAELSAIITNLLSNVIKAAGHNGRIRASAVMSTAALIFRLENTGKRVHPEHGEKWFRAFATTSRDSDASLGKGMGLGLTITRRMLDEYGWQVQFSKPRRNFSTCVEVSFGP